MLKVTIAALTVLAAVLLMAGLKIQGIQPSLPESHIEANIPPRSDFDRFLFRDLRGYFESQGNTVADSGFELLRQHPTQNGVGYPKYYVWLWYKRSDGLKVEGAASVSAQDKVQFYVTRFLSREQILSDPTLLGSFIPKELIKIIESKMQSPARQASLKRLEFR
jgi:hypothetical protein